MMLEFFRNSFFYKNYSSFIQENNYLLNNSAYSIFSFLISPFKNPNSQKQKDFNHFHSNHHIVIKRAFERSKIRFEMLKNLNIKTVKMEILFTYYIIILYNFLKINMNIW